MPFIRFRLTFVLTIFLFFTPAAAQEQAIALHWSLTTAGQTTEGQLADDDTHIYRLILAAGYLLSVTPERSQQTTAQYSLVLQDKHAATATDRERFALHQLDTEVIRLYRQQQKSALQQAAAQGRAAGALWHSPWYWAAFTLQGEW